VNRRSIAVVMAWMSLAAAAMAAEVPRKAPEFAMQLVNGEQILLSQYRGKVVALEFLSTTCPHCQQCSAVMNKLYKEYGPQGFQPLGVAFNDRATLLVPDYIKQLGLSFPVGVSPREPVVQFIQHPADQILYVPQLLIIDRKGVIRGQYAGSSDFFKAEAEEANMRAEIEKLLKEGAAKPRAAVRRK
jgi:peroxiredoxin